MASNNSNNHRLFRRAFREASPIFGRSPNDNEPEIEPNIQVSEEEIEFARRMTSSIERLTDIARRDSFSSISSYGQREQFKTALTNIQTSIFGEKEKTPIMDHKPQPSGSNDSDHDFEHLEAPDPFELASYHASIAAAEGGDTTKTQKMSHEFPHDKSPKHYQPLAQQHEPVDPFGGHGDNHNILGHNKEAVFVDLDSSEPVAASHHQIFTKTGINIVNTVPEPPNANVFDSPFHTEHNVDNSQFHAEPRFDSPPLLTDDIPQLHADRQFNSPPSPPQPEMDQHKMDSDFNQIPPRPPTPPHHKMDSPLLPDEPSPAHHFDDDNYPAHYSPQEEERRHIEENIHAAVHDTQGEVDAILERLHTPDPAEVAVPPAPEDDISPSGDSERDTVGRLVGEKYNNEPEPNMPTSDSTHGMRENSPDEQEQTFDRRGPLTIPSHAEKNDSPTHENINSSRTTADDEFESAMYNSSDFNQIPPRPPTPPKELNDEPDDVKPPKLDLGPAPSHQPKSPDDTTGLKPILKHHSDVEPWLSNRHVDQRVLDIIYWRDPKKSGIVLAAIFVTLFLVAKFSLISLTAYSALAVLVATLGFRVFKLAEAKFKKTDDKNPFQHVLEKDIDVPQEKIHAQVDVLVENARNMALQLRRLFFVENVLDSVKFFFLLYSLTYIGAWFSGCTLIILFVIGVFTIPKVYEINKEPIDNYLNLAKENVDKLNHTVGEKLPFLKQGPVAPPAVKKDE